MSTHNIGFHGEIRNSVDITPLMCFQINKGIGYFLYKHVSLSIQKMILYLFELRFYSPVTPMESCRAWSVYLIYLTTLLLDRLSPLSS